MEERLVRSIARDGSNSLYEQTVSLSHPITSTPTHAVDWSENSLYEQTVSLSHPITSTPTHTVDWSENSLFGKKSLSLFSGNFPGGSGLAGTRLFPFSILLEISVMEVVVTTGARRCAAPVKMLPPTDQHPTFYKPDALPVAQPTASKHWREIILQVFRSCKRYRGLCSGITDGLSVCINTISGYVLFRNHLILHCLPGSW